MDDWEENDNLVDFFSWKIEKIKKEFRRLRTATRLRAWTAPGRRPGPAFRPSGGLPYPFFAEKNLRFAEDDASTQIFRFIFSETPYLLACGIKILTKIPSSRSSFS